MAMPIYTIGHSTWPVHDFTAQLGQHGITAVADVRSSPYSRFNPQFNREALKRELADCGVRYVFLGDELGARSDDPCCYVGDKVQYKLLAKTCSFESGLNRVIEGSKEHRIALMCAEKEPLDCHRTILVARELVNRGHEVVHILADGSLEPHPAAMRRLMDQLGMSGQDMFRSFDEIVDEAYSRQSEKIAYDRSAAVSVRDVREDDGNAP